MVKWNSKQLEDILKFGIGVGVIILCVMLVNKLGFRVDLTEEKRFSIKEPTKKLLEDLDDVVFIEVYLDGELNSGFQRLQQSIREVLEEFRRYGGSNIQFVFNDPTASMSAEAQGEFMRALSDKGIQPTNIIDQENGQRTERLVYPGALVSYGGADEGVMLLKGNQTLSAEEKLNQSIENIEYELASAIEKLTSLNRKVVGLSSGSGELTPIERAGLTNSLRTLYRTKEIFLSEPVDGIDALIIAKPTERFSEVEKYNLDQYLMKGGKVLMLIDRLWANMDSASYEYNYALSYDLNLDDQLFRYGVRVNANLVQEKSAGVYPIVVGNMGDQPQVRLMQWPFYPVINRYGDHVITRNLDALIGRFTSSVDSISSPAKKQVLLMTSDYSRTVNAPVKVSVQDLRQNLTPDLLNQQNIPLGWLLEESFESLYKNRFLPEGIDSAGYLADSRPSAKLIVIGDGDLARNEINPRTGNPQPLGFDPFTSNTYANEDFIMNCMAYLVDDNGLILARNKEIKLRPLDEVKMEEERLYWQVINLVVPLLLLLVFGIIRFYLRKKKYTGFDTHE